MKKIGLLAMSLSFGLVLTAQVEAADLSPRATVNQKVGLTEFELDYSRPSARDRKVFGEVVSYDKKWRTGANLNTTLSFNTDIVLENDTISAGKYSIFVTPKKSSWEIYLYDKTDLRGVPREWDDNLVVYQTTKNVEKVSDKVETFTISFDNLKTDEFELAFSWDDVRVSLPISLPTIELTRKSIEDVMSGPSDRDYYLAASFNLDQKENLNEALEFINHAISLRGEEAFWYTRKKALIQYELSDIDGAIETAELSKKHAEAVNYSSYVKMNEEDIQKWKKEK